MTQNPGAAAPGFFMSSIDGTNLLFFMQILLKSHAIDAFPETIPCAMTWCSVPLK
jgi:hypothetical protein